MAKKFVSKKTLGITAVFACAIISCSLFAIIFGVGKNDKPLSKSATTFYDISLEYNGTSVVASQEIMYESPCTLDRLVFNLYANAVGNDSTIDILSAQINQQHVDFEIYGHNNEFVKLPCALNRGDVCTISFEYEVTLAKSNDRLGITDDGIVNLTCFYPILAKYDNGWREDEYTMIGDPFFCDVASYFVSVCCDQDLQVAGSGIVDGIDKVDNKQIVRIDAENIRSLGLVIGDMNFVSATTNIGTRDVNVNYYYTKDSNFRQSLDRICDSLALFSSAFGEYPYTSYTIAQSDLGNAGGMEYGAFAIVSPSVYREEYLDSITHETAHQWWYNTVGSDQINNAWLDEGLSEFCTYYFHYLNGDRGTFSSSMAQLAHDYNVFDSQKAVIGGNYNMNKPLADYASNEEYVSMVYLKGAMLFDLIHSIVGDEKFRGALSHYYESNKFGIATQDSLIDAFKTQGYDLSSIIENWISDKAPV